MHVQAASHLVRTLEAQHGVAARSLELRSADLALRARAVARGARDTLARANKEVYHGHPDVTTALSNYSTHLEREAARLDELARRARVRLEKEYGFEVSEQEIIVNRAREMGKAKEELMAEIDSVQRDIQRLLG